MSPRVAADALDNAPAAARFAVRPTRLAAGASMKDLEGLTRSVPRLEDQRFITGTATYIDDVNLPGQAWAAILRSERAHAKIAAINVSRARAAAGVLLVLTGKDWVAAGHGPIPTKSPVRTRRDGSPFSEPKPAAAVPRRPSSTRSSMRSPTTASPTSTCLLRR